MTFAEELRAFAAKSKARAALVHKKVAIDLFTRIIERTPVDTGRLRGNWQAELRQYADGVLDNLDEDGAKTIGMMVAKIESAPANVALTLTNNLPYARRIEYDNWSQQAPGGMVRISAREFKDIVASVVGAEP